MTEAPRRAPGRRRAPVLRGRVIRMAAAALVGFIGWAAGDAAAQGFPDWRAIELQGARLGNSVSVSIRLDRAPAAGIEKGFLDFPRGRPFAAGGAAIGLLEVTTRIEPLAHRPVALVSRVWFDPAGATPLQRYRSRRGEGDYDQTFRFGPEGVFRRQLEPRSPEEAAKPPEGWTKRDESFYARPGGPGAMTETSLLMVILSAAELEAGSAPEEVVVFNRRQFHRIVMRPGALRRLPAALVVHGPGEAKRVVESLEAIPVALEARPLDPGAKDPEHFSFLGLTEGVVLFLEKGTRLPVQVNGALPGVGSVELRAREITLARR